MKLDGYPFEIFPDGRIKGPSGRFLNPSPNSDGYRLVWYGPRVNCKSVKVHTLVCTAFHGPRPSPDHEVCHLNDNRSDNRAENLAWGTKEDNAKDRVINSRHNWARLTWGQVDEIRERYAPGTVTYRALADEYGVSLNTIIRIVKRQTFVRHRV